MRFKELLWKVPLITIAIVILFFEVNSYTNTKGSIGELILYPYQERAFQISTFITAILGAGLIFMQSKTSNIIFTGAICLILFLFLPSFDMQGVNNPF